MPDPIEELKKSILDLEQSKSKLVDMLSWRDTEAPKIRGDIEKINLTLHELRQDLDKIKNSAVPAAPEEPKKGGVLGFFGL